MDQHVSYRTVKVDGLYIFYREAGPKDAPTILLLHRTSVRRSVNSPLKLSLGHAPHGDVEDQTSGLINLFGCGEVFR